MAMEVDDADELSVTCRGRECGWPPLRKLPITGFKEYIKIGGNEPLSAIRTASKIE
jgi:hypothetical protein